MEGIKLLEGEEFKPINNYPKYFVSNCGRVYSTKSQRFIGSINKKIGYITVSLTKGKITKTTYIHALVMEHFGPEKPEGEFEIDHQDKNKENNNISNLRWLSHQDNLLNRNEYTKDRKKRLGKHEIEAFNRWYICGRSRLMDLSNEALAKKFLEEKDISIHQITIRNNRDRWRIDEKTDKLVKIPDDE